MDLSKLSDAELDAMIAAQQPTNDLSSIPDDQLDALISQQQPGFMSRVGQDFANTRNDLAALSSYNQSPVSNALQATGALAGFANNAVGEGFQSLANYFPETTGALKNFAMGAKDAIVNNPVSQVIGQNIVPPIAAAAGYALQNVQNKDPEGYRNLQAGANIAPWLVGAGGKSGANIALDAADNGGKVLASGARVLNPSEAISTVVAGAGARAPDALDAVTATLKQKSSDIYRFARESGAVVSPKASPSIYKQVEDAVVFTGKINKDLHRNTLSVLKDMKSGLSKEIGLEELEQYRMLLNDVVNSGTDVTGKLDADAFKASRAVDALDDAIDKINPEQLISGDVTASKAFQAAREQWKQYRKFDSVSNVLKKADGDPNRIKSGLQRFVTNKKNLRGFTGPEKEALVAAAKNSTTEKILKMFGKFGIDLGSSLTPGNTALPAIAGYVGSPLVVAGGTVARQGQKYLARGKAEKALNILESGSI